MMKIETFKGRKGKYNVAILKALYKNGYLKAWDLAKTIVENDPTRQKSNWYHESQKVNSVLLRKSGTLERLLKKEFIQKTDSGYCLTIYKGLCTSLTLLEKVEVPAIEEMTIYYEKLPEFKEMCELIYQQHPEAKIELYEEILQITKELLNQGWNIDVVSNMRFNKIFFDYYNEYLLSHANEKRKMDKKWNPSIELQEAMLKFLDRMKQTAVEAVKQLEKEMENFKKSKIFEKEMGEKEK